MSTTVTYKGDTLTTVNNATKTLKTAGKYMEGDVILIDVTEEYIDGDNLGYGIVISDPLVNTSIVERSILVN